MRAGLIKRLGAGIYSYMPMGLRVIRKVEAIIREEMNRAGAVELLMPVVQPAELWQETRPLPEDGPRTAAREGPPRARLHHPADQRRGHHRHRAPGAAQLPALPRNFYHIQTKFRDERRPRFGVMRGREFTMKDAYSFDRDVEAARRSYERCTTPTARIFERMGLQLPRRRGRHRRDRRRPLARVPGHRRHRRGRDRLLPGLGLRRQHRTGRGPGADRRARPRRRSRWRRRRRPARPPARTWPRCSACRCSAPSSRWCSPPTTSDAGRRRASTTTRLAAARARRPRLNEVKAGKVAGSEGRLPLRHGGRDRRRASAASPATSGPIGHASAGQGGGRPHRGAR